MYSNTTEKLWYVLMCIILLQIKLYHCTSKISHYSESPGTMAEDIKLESCMGRVCGSHDLQLWSLCGYDQTPCVYERSAGT